MHGSSYGHLSDTELHPLVEGEANPTPAAQAHLMACELCRGRLAALVSGQRSIESLRVPAPAPATSRCPANEELHQAAVGMGDPARNLELLAHAGSCDHCGPILREALDDLEAEPVNLNIAPLTESRKKELSARLAASSKTPAPRRSFSPVRWGAVAAAILLAAGGVWWWRMQQQPPMRLLAEAFTGDRQLEMRLPEARYAPLQTRRNGNADGSNRPLALLEAELRIAKGIAKHPNDPAWLDAKSRADLLEGRYDPAITSLRRALSLQPDDPALLGDLGIAYFERAGASGQPSDDAVALDLLGKALQHRPNDAVLLFNHALACERLLLIDAAIADWKRFLKTEPPGGWEKEGRSHLAELEKKKRAAER